MTINFMRPCDMTVPRSRTQVRTTKIGDRPGIEDVSRHTCPTCSTYAYHGNYQKAIDIDGVRHHPSCTKIGAETPATADDTPGHVDPIWWVFAIIGGALVWDNWRFRRVRR